MKIFKKMMAIAVSFLMMLAMATTVFAVNPADYSITVNNAKAGETYTAYKMFDLSVNDPTNPTAFRYTVNSAWASFAETPEFKAVYTVDEQGYVTSKETSTTKWAAASEMSKVADAAAKFAKDNGISEAGHVTIESGQTSGKINLSGPGYYVVSSTLGTRAMIETTPAEAAVTINEKNEEDTIDKKVKEGDTYGTNSDAQVGDTVEFKSEVTIVPRSVNVKIHDTMDSGLTLNTSSIKVYTDEALTTEYSAANVKTGAQADSDDTFTIVIPDAFAATATANQKLYIVYTAEINQNAVVKDSNGVAIVDQNNKTHVAFGDGTTSEEKTTTTTTHKFTVHKHATGETTNLADAIFQVKKGDVVVNLVKLDDNNYRVVDDTETTAPVSHVGTDNSVNTVVANTIVSDFVTVSGGDIVIWGVDSGEGYSILEIQAPKGYNMISTNPVTITVDANNSTTTDVENKTGTVLPSTGGIGTTIFYALGTLLIAGSAILFVNKRRQHS